MATEGLGGTAPPPGGVRSQRDWGMAPAQGARICGSDRFWKWTLSRLLLRKMPPNGHFLARENRADTSTKRWSGAWPGEEWPPVSRAGHLARCPHVLMRWGRATCIVALSSLVGPLSGSCRVPAADTVSDVVSLRTSILARTLVDIPLIGYMSDAREAVRPILSDVQRFTCALRGLGAPPVAIRRVRSMRLFDVPVVPQPTSRTRRRSSE